MKKILTVTAIALTAIGLGVRAITKLEIKKENDRVQNQLKIISEVTSRPNFRP